MNLIPVINKAIRIPVPGDLFQSTRLRDTCELSFFILFQYFFRSVLSISHQQCATNPNTIRRQIASYSSSEKEHRQYLPYIKNVKN